ncbi:type VII secretion target [Nocardia brasiliensis]|nr:type VII secretion target [Nocardia brasiliensis]
MTDNFSVEPDVLDRVSSRLHKLSTDNAQANQYIDGWLDVRGDVGGVFPNVAATIQHIRAELTTNYAELGRITSESADELGNAAQMYRSTDRARAAELDRTYPGERR